MIASFGPEWMGLVGWEWGTAALTGGCLLLEEQGRAERNLEWYGGLWGLGGLGGSGGGEGIETEEY